MQIVADRRRSTAGGVGRESFRDSLKHWGQAACLNEQLRFSPWLRGFPRFCELSAGA